MPQRQALIAYGIPALPAQFLFVLTTVYFIKFGTDVLLVAPGTLALVFGLARLWDAVSDPLAGFLSDRTTSRFGRRRTWIFGSAVPVALTAVMLWSPPEGLTDGALLAWLVVALFGFSTAYTAFEVPHNALGAEVSDRLEVRASLFGVRAWMLVAGTYASLTLGIAAIRTADDPRAAATWLVGGVGVLYAAAAIFGTARLAERPEFAGRGGRSPLQAGRDLLGNRHARRIMIVVFCEYLGTGGAAVLIAYLYQYVLDAPGLTELAFVVMGIAQVVSVPLWARMARRTDKSQVWRIAMAAAATGCMLQFVVGWMGASAGVFIAVSFLYAFGASATHAVGPALLADVVDADELATGERKEGVYYAGWHFTRKSTQALMVVASGAALQWVGFVPNAAQSETTQMTILALATLAPALGYAVGAVLLAGFGLRGERLDAMRADLADRRTRESTARPS